MVVPPPVVRIYRNVRHASHIVLPLAWVGTSVAAQRADPAVMAVLGLAGIPIVVGIILLFGKRILVNERKEHSL